MLYNIELTSVQARGGLNFVELGEGVITDNRIYFVVDR